MDEVVGLVLADHHRAFIDGLAMLLDAHQALAVLGVAHDDQRAVALAAVHRPAVFLLDVDLPDGNPAGTVTAIKAASPTTRVVLLADAGRTPVEVPFLAGADGCLTRHSSSREVANAIREAAAGRSAAMAVTAGRSRHDADHELVHTLALTSREREVLDLLAAGWSSRRIAQACGVSLTTVRTHVANLLLKLDAHSKLEAVAFAVEHGIVAMPRSGRTIAG